MLSKFELPSEDLWAPASFDQERCWELRGELGSAFDPTVAFAQEVIGDVDVLNLGHAFLHVQRLHESLRTVLAPGADGGVTQHILPEPIARLECETSPAGVAPSSESELRQWLQRRIESEAEGGWDWERGPLFRALFVTIEPRRHLLLFLASHAITDGWSLHVVNEEIGRVYGKTLDQQPMAASDSEKPQFREWVAAQRTELSGSLLAQKLSFWRAHLGDDPMVLESGVPLRVARGDGVADTRRISFPASVSTLQLRRLASDYRISHNTLFLTILYHALAELGRSDRVAVSIPYLNRPTKLTQQIVGWLSNRLMIAHDPQGSLEASLEIVHRTVLDAIRHGDVPKPLIRRALWGQDYRTEPEATGIYFASGGMLRPALKIDGVSVSEIPLGAPDRMHGGLKVIARPEPLPGIEISFGSAQFDEKPVQTLGLRMIELLEGLVRSNR